MSIEITFGGTCRDIAKLPAAEADLRGFFMNELVPALWEDFSSNIRIARQAPADRAVNIAIGERGCEIGGTLVFKL